MHRLLSVPLGLALMAAAAETQLLEVPVSTPPASEILARISKRHPRLILDDAALVKLRGTVAGDPTLARWEGELNRRAERVLQEPVSRYEIPDGLRLLATSRRVLDRTYLLGLAFRLNGDSRMSARLWLELEAAAAFPDWNPRHFLDTAEMTHAFAIAYDWLYAEWSAEQRAVLKGALVSKGLQLGVDCHRGKSPHGWWVRSEHNWNQVCNGGVGLGALAVADEQPELAGALLEASLRSIQLAVRHYAPDGAWSEGPGYWNYATQYTVGFLAGLQSACGTDFGLSRIPGLSEAGFFPVYSTGPTGRTFNYADGGDSPVRSPAMFWLARRYGQTAFETYARHWARPQPLDLVWAATSGETKSPLPLPVARHFRGADVVVFRGSWTDEQATFVGFKAGDNKANHSHLDLGTFVLDSLKVRWVEDLGAENYNLPGYFGAKRWDYYRLRAEGHNTLVLNPGTEPDQNPTAAGSISLFKTSTNISVTVADLSPAYLRVAETVRRGVALLGGRDVLVQDEVKPRAMTDAWWFWHTQAAVQLEQEGRSALLEFQGRRLRASVIHPATAVFVVQGAQPMEASPQPEGQNANPGTRKLAVHWRSAAPMRLAVVFAPIQEATAAVTPPEILPLDQWDTLGSEK